MALLLLALSSAMMGSPSLYTGFSLWPFLIIILCHLLLLPLFHPLQHKLAAAQTSPSSPSALSSPPAASIAGTKPQNWTWCVDSADNLALCQQMIKILVSIDPNTDHAHSCVRTLEGDEACMEMIRNGEAMFSVFDGGEIWEAYNLYNLIPIRTQHSDIDGSPRYYGVGVVRAGGCPSSLFQLRGKRSCHTGYGRASGWTLPITFLLNNKIMPLITKNASKMHDIQSVEAFFKKSCAISEESSNGICTSCKITSQCNDDDRYYSYAGAFRCLVEDSGDIAFTKGTIPSLFAEGGIFADTSWENLQPPSHYKLVCPNSSCADVDQYKSCNFGSAPGHTIMVSNQLDKSHIEAFHNVMDDAVTNAAYVKLFSSASSSGSGFASGVSRSSAYNGTVQELLGHLYQTILDLDHFNSLNSTSLSSSSNSSSLCTALSIVLLWWMIFFNSKFLCT
ncbi:hypothetical protein GOP47_0015712 [Adiantum capillus-veneris]|uniref:Transferrin-like domain-containing protein n=1 Tax=Adiantum capillus-veneris TaxID=13818 RepID=A0A9D4UK81_ADICA|nr:hypothetical protein GOP47_0015712 [Adiantum capillus-veneris]